jgi:hypothetical protein
MKTRFLLLSFLMVSAVIISQAAVISVVNGDNLQTKITNATAGDVLVVGPGTYAGVTISKKLTLIGPGYFRSGGAATVAGVTFDANGSGSYFSGFEVTGAFQISGNNITAKRNKVTNNFYVGYGASLANIIVSENYCSALVLIGSSSSYQLSNFRFSNNICLSNVNFDTGSTSSGLVVNNTFRPDSSTSSGNIYITYGDGVQNVSFYNNIFTTGFGTSATSRLFHDATRTPLNFKWNIVGPGSTVIPIPANNLTNQNWSPLFAGFPSNITGLNDADGRVLLKALSPALNYGRKSPYGVSDPTTDAGAFGGDQPYVLSGIPVGPYIYSMAVPSLAAANSVIPVTIKAKTNN